MSVRLVPAIVAGILALAFAFLLFVPFVAREYRKRGELRAGSVALRFGALLYGLGLGAYVLLPLPETTPDFCANFAGLTPQWEPLASLTDLHRPRSWTELSDLLANGSIRQFGYNVALFVPLGMLLRHLGGRTVIVTVSTAFGVSLIIELTQLTGIWFVYPCPYRLFDVDDLIANTGGGLAGVLFAPLLRQLPGQQSQLAATAPRPVTPGRRMVGMLCDVLLLWWLGLASLRAFEVVVAAADIPVEPGDEIWLESWALWFGPAMLLLLCTVLARGTTLGQHAVLLRTVHVHRHRVPVISTLVRWGTGLGGLAVGEGVLHASAWDGSGAIFALVWCSAHGFAAARATEGITGRLASLYVVDTRDRDRRSRNDAAVLSGR